MAAYGDCASLVFGWDVVNRRKLYNAPCSVRRYGASIDRFGHFGFGLYYVRNFAQILGETGQIPILFAAYAPPLATILLAMGIILHLEDG